MRSEASAQPAEAARRSVRQTVRDTVRAYVALAKPRIIWLLLVTTVPAMVLAERGWPSTWLIVATLIGGTLAAGGANAINQVADRDIDELMRRTSARPLPRGNVTPSRALVFGLALGAVSAIWLSLTVNLLAAGLAIGALGFYVLVYSYYLKRSTTQNIVLGGAAGAAPPVIGWAAVTGQVGIEPLFLFLIVFYWTPPHFWALALVFSDDYERAGVPMLPVVRGEAETKRQIVLYTLMLIGLTLAFTLVGGLSLIYFLTAVGGGAAFLYLAVRLARSDGIEDAMPLFHYSIAYLVLLFASVAVDELVLG
ncbi:MAG: protoheme IX farnesyltransferase [Chloroflexi bacterium]|nr:protoheme IX farnesyltransferase [Chloroflexota bacterium]